MQGPLQTFLVIVPLPCCPSSQSVVMRRAEDMMRRMQAQFRAVEREAQAKDVALQQLMQQANMSRTVGGGRDFAKAVNYKCCYRSCSCSCAHVDAFGSVRHRPYGVLSLRYCIHLHTCPVDFPRRWMLCACCCACHTIVNPSHTLSLCLSLRCSSNTAHA